MDAKQVAHDYTDTCFTLHGPLKTLFKKQYYIENANETEVQSNEVCNARA